MRVVQSLSYLTHDFHPEPLILVQQVPVKAVWSQPLVEVGLLRCLDYIVGTE
jgi:hypothetical protein